MIKKFKKKDGSTVWGFVAYLGVDPITGKQRRTTRRGFTTKRSAQQALRELEVASANQTVVQQNKTFGEAYGEWLKFWRKTVKPSTVTTVTNIFNVHILPYLQERKLKRITGAVLQQLINQYPLHMVRSITTRINQVFKFALRLGYMEQNPLDQVIIPRQTKTVKQRSGGIHFLTLTQVKELLANVGTSKYAPLVKARDYALLRLLIFSGLRIGEALALQWSDLESGMIQVNKTLMRTHKGWEVSSMPKTVASVRTIALDQHTLEVLAQWRKQQPAGINIMFQLSAAKPVRAATLNVHLKQYLVGLPQITLHGLRHTHASLLFASGASMKDVQVRLGHSNIQTTMNIYTHIMPEHTKQVTQRFFDYVSAS